MPHIRPQSTVDSALKLSDDGVPDRDNARIHGVAVKTIRRWRREYQRRGRPRGQSHTTAACPRCDGVELDQNAYAELLGWYLGDGHITRSHGDVFDLHIYNDERYRRTNAHIRDVLTRVKPGGRPHARSMPGCLNTTVSWKHWPCLFPQHGAGRKHTRAIELEPWQEEIVAAHPGAFVRGLFHSDGCRVTNWTVRPLARGPKRYEYPRYFFSNESADIMGICGRALDMLEVEWTLPRRNLLSVARKQSVAILDEYVGPKS